MRHFAPKCLFILAKAEKRFLCTIFPHPLGRRVAKRESPGQRATESQENWWLTPRTGFLLPPMPPFLLLLLFAHPPFEFSPFLILPGLPAFSAVCSEAGLCLLSCYSFSYYLGYFQLLLWVFRRISSGRKQRGLQRQIRIRDL